MASTNFVEAGGETHKEYGSVKGGHAATEKLVKTGDPDYDVQMQRLWGGPVPKYFDLALQIWPTFCPGAGKTALITGSSGGIGFYIARIMARCGYTIIVPKRTGFEDDAAGAVEGIQRETPGATVIVPDLPLDLTSLDSCRTFGQSLVAEYQTLDVLALNAGRGGAKDDPREEIDGMETIMLTNVYGHFVLAFELMPLLKATPGARVVTQSSMARAIAKPEKVGDLDGTDQATYNSFDQYCLSKAACVLMTKALNDRLDKAGVDVTCLATDPGLTSTGVNIQHQLTHSLKDTDFSALLGAAETTNQIHDVMGHHAADGALAMSLASMIVKPQRNDFYASAVLDAPPPGATLTDALVSPSADRPWPADASETFFAQAVAKTGVPADFGL
uniref:Protochlorophyllide reductase n=1 Tax=Noctiluca scintillans TaxID=2966 RepID=A0A7S1A8Y6_NOCSC|mmetsp:Transcript_36357/g.96666  ORF Transcript_36357/g.96666 Transcript_36357/m.96666 type:complete len:388 (+) Transcript_36357:53-1216(+)|eukprot:CAMPEP_0194489576 /NCGR_PEP_ID=MMETSP0253-20130528/9069_1 /TAXON_ID=2966 /ORGANISM="Noctiluca scintillans" /LENGTH=387 /DNA_ID=CAMNT_0039330067 /DNA_START=9 /DNA_END=1172 /DNA_ORIENTATION=-